MDNSVRILPPGAPRSGKTRPGAAGGLLPILMALLYGVSPIDLIPDLIPLLGWTDDMMVFVIAAVMIFKWLRRRKQADLAERMPPRFK